MNSQNNNENNNNTDTADKETKHYDNIYSNSNKQPSQTGESAASNDEKGNVQYADRSIRDDINDYKFVKSYKSHGHHKHHRHHHSSKENADDVLLVQSSRPAKGSSNKIKKKSLSTDNEKYLQEYDELVKSNHPAMGSKEQKKAIVTSDASVKSSTNFISKTVDRIKRGECVVVIASNNGYTKIRTENGKIGYIKSNQLENEFIVLSLIHI